jgi:hypothetical protein
MIGTFERTRNMAKCLNCAKNATYNVKNAGAPAQDFCDAHLPKFFNKKNLPEHVTATDDRIKERAEAAANFEAEKAKAEAAVETPKPVKKKAVAEPKAEPTPEPTPEAVAEAVAEEPVAE